MRRLTTRTAIAATAAVLVAAGCRDVAARVFTPPRAELKGVALRGLGPRGGQVDVALTVHNDNPYALTSTGMTYRLYAEDSVEVGRGGSSDTVRVAAHDSATVRLPLDVDWRGLQVAGLRALGAGAVAYRIVGEVTASTPVGSYAVPLDARGRAALGGR